MDRPMLISNGAAGFTLIDTLLAAIIGSIAVLAMTFFMGDYADSVNEATRKKRSIDLANEILDDIEKDVSASKEASGTKRDISISSNGLEINHPVGISTYQTKCSSADTSGTKSNLITTTCSPCSGTNYPHVEAKRKSKSEKYPSSVGKQKRITGAAAAALCVDEVDGMINVTVEVFYDTSGKKVKKILKTRSYELELDDGIFINAD